MTKADIRYFRELTGRIHAYPEDARELVEASFERGRKRRVTIAMATMMVSIIAILQMLLCVVEH